MSTMRFKPEQIMDLLCKIGVEIANGKTPPPAPSLTPDHCGSFTTRELTRG
jgi:hypothetical protein